MRSDFNLAAGHLLQFDPVAKRGGTKRSAANISDVGAAAPSTDIGDVDGGIGETRVHLRYHEDDEYADLSKEQQDELREWRAGLRAKKKRKTDGGNNGGGKIGGGKGGGKRKNGKGKNGKGKNGKGNGKGKFYTKKQIASLINERLKTNATDDADIAKNNEAVCAAITKAVSDITLKSPPPAKSKKSEDNPPVSVQAILSRASQR